MMVRVKGMTLAIALVSGTACSPAVDQPQARPGAIPIDCAIDGAERFETVCFVERATVDGVVILTIRHPDGGFRRLEPSADGRSLSASDGADPVRSIERGDVLELHIADDRYRVPDTALEANGS